MLLIKKLSFLLFILLFTSELEVSATNSISISDPRNRNSYKSRIEEMVVVMKPMGVYTECGIYLTFSVRGSVQNNNVDSCEIAMFFDLNKNAIINDSWLWIDNYISKAFLLDRWTASSIYEGIVKRRRDPSVLYKNSSIGYEMRIFPLISRWQDTTSPFAKRKVKINIMLPTNWTANTVLTDLPFAWASLANFPPEKIKLIVYETKDFKNPRIQGYPEIQFAEQESTEDGRILTTDILYNTSKSLSKIEFDTPLKNGIYMNTSTKNGENFYQMVMIPSQALQFESKKKVCILVDYDNSKSSYKPLDILNTIKAMLHSTLTSKDSFNLIPSSLDIEPISSNWLPADSATIDIVLGTLGNDFVSSYSNLPSLMAKGINYVNAQNDSAMILVIANSDNNGKPETANQLLYDLKKIIKPYTLIHTADFCTNGTVYSFNNKNYYGNEYFFTNISKMTGGNYYSIQKTNSSLSELLMASFQNLGGELNTFDIYSSFKDGFCYGKFKLSETTVTTGYGTPVVEVGKYVGDYPFDMIATGFSRAQAFSKKITLQKEDASAENFPNKTIWAGAYIRSLEAKSPQTNEISLDIVNNSLDNRILSLYTAFLALEQKDTINNQTDPTDPNGDTHNTSVASSNQTNEIIQFKAYPNPFSLSTNIFVEIPDNLIATDVSIQVFDYMGQNIRTFDISKLSGTKLFVNWDGRNDKGDLLPNGTYMIVVSTLNSKQVFKVILMR